MIANSILARFDAPAQDDRPAVMWFWNDRIDKLGIRTQLEAFRRAGITDFYVHPTWGMELEYLSDEFFELVRYAVDIAGELGLFYNIYDDYNWPSGGVGGKLLREEPWTASKKLLCTRIPLFSGQSVERLLQGELISAQVVYGDKQQTVTDVTEALGRAQTDYGLHVFYQNDTCSSCTLCIQCAAVAEGLTASCMWGKYTDFETGSLDTNNPAAVRRFIDYTHERYKAAVGNEFGKTIRTLFTDEVSTMVMFDAGEGVFPWTDILPGEFERDYGYALAPCLHLLRGAPTDEALKLRYDYWRIVTRLFSRGYYQQCCDWCRENRLAFTGHLSGEGILYWHAFQMGDFYRSISEIEVPGMDSILSKLELAAHDSTFGMEARMLASAAKFAGRSRVMCETFSGSGWDMTLGEMRRIMNRLALQGINYFIYMGAFYSLDGSRKHMPMGYPPSHGWNNPLFVHYGLLQDYMGRICALSAQTRPAAEVLLLLPQVTQYMEPQSDGHHDIAWRATAEALTTLSVPFDFFFEPLAARAHAERGRIVLDADSYDTLIVPGAKYLDDATVSLLEAFALSGGRVLYVNEVPIKTVDTGRTLRLLDESAQPDGGFSCSMQGNVAYSRVERHDEAGHEQFQRFLYLFTHGSERAIALDMPSAGIYASHRRAQEAELYWILNDSDEPRRVTGRLTAKGGVWVLDPATGSKTPLPTRDDEDRRRFLLPLEAGAMVALYCPHEAADAACKPLPMPAKRKIMRTMDGPYAFRPVGGNLLALRMKLAADISSLLQVLDRGDRESIARAPKLFGVSSGAPQELAGGSALHFGDRYAAVAGIAVRDVPGDATLFVELDEHTQVYVNGRRVDSFVPCRIWGPRGTCASVGGLLVPGDNSVVIESHIPEWAAPHDIPTAFLQGDFMVLQGDVLAAPSETITPGSWTEKGYPYFCGEGVYTATFMAEPHRRVFLRVVTQDTVSVRVNGIDCGTAAWPPYEFDVTKALRSSGNVLELTFTSTYSNYMDAVQVQLLYQGVAAYVEEPKQNLSGLLEPVELQMED